MRLRPADLAAIAAFNTGVARSRAEYREHPIAGRFNDKRQQPCSVCQEPTYSERGLCAAHRKGDT